MKYTYRIGVEREATEMGNDRFITEGHIIGDFDNDPKCQNESGEITAFGYKTMVTLLAGAICEISRNGLFSEGAVISDAVKILEYSVSEASGNYEI